MICVRLPLGATLSRKAVRSVSFAVSIFQQFFAIKATNVGFDLHKEFYFLVQVHLHSDYLVQIEIVRFKPAISAIGVTIAVHLFFSSGYTRSND